MLYDIHMWEVPLQHCSLCIVWMLWLFHGADTLCVCCFLVVQSLRGRSRWEGLGHIREMTLFRTVVGLEEKEEEEWRKPTGVVLMPDNLVNLF